MKPPIFLSIVMPAYNEQPDIEAVIREHVEAVTKLADSLDDWEIVCLDDASQDGTAAVIEKLSQQTNKIRLLRHAENKGIYQSQTDLYLNARGTHIYSTGSDGQWPASNLLEMFPPLQAGADGRTLEGLDPIRPGPGRQALRGRPLAAARNVGARPRPLARNAAGDHGARPR